MRRLLGAGAAVLALALVAAPAASADARIGPDEVVVDSPHGRVVVERAPLRLTFQDARGRTVLRQAASSVPAQPGALVDPEPAGLENVKEPRLYAPFAFEVGGERSLQYYGGFWQGNMLTSAQAGAIHSATQVLEAQPDGDGALMTVATTDPSRTLRLRVTPDAGTAFRVQVTPSDTAGISAIGDAFESGEDEAFRGFGGRHNLLDQRGTAFYNWSEQENFGSGPFAPAGERFPGGGGDRYMAPNGPHAAYYPQSLFVSSRPYGFLLNGTPLSRWRMASDRPDAWQVSIGGAELDYSVALGEAPRAIETLTEINGRHRVPPDWALGPTLSRAVFILGNGSDDAESYAQKIERDLDKVEELELPVDAFTYEAWAALPEPFVEKTNARMRRMGIHPMGYMRSFLSPDKIIEPPEPYREAIEKGYVATTPAGTPYYYLSGVSTEQAVLIDFTDPEAVAWWKRRIRHMLDLGFDGFMQDFGEQVLTDMRFDNGETGATMHNRYPVLFHRITREVVEEWEREHPERGRIFVYTRAGFSGRPGAAAYEDANFPGDETTDWNRGTGIASLAPDMLNRGVGGAVGFTTDIGGYIDSYADNLDKELFIRWSQWAALSTVFRVHNSCCEQGQRMPWDFDEEALEAWRRAAAVHTAARPLIRRAWEEAERTGTPVARPLWLSFPGDPEAAEQEQQWMLGDDVLVAPVVEKGATSRRVYFPAGCWRHGETGERFTGPAQHEVKAPLTSLPHFLRCEVASLAQAGAAAVPARSPRAACVGRPPFRSTTVRPRGRGLEIDFRRRIDRPVAIDVFQTSDGRRVVRERRVARFRGRERGERWSGRVPDGVYFVRLRVQPPGARPDVRRHVVVRRDGRFSVRRPHYRRASCGLLTSFKLTRPAFGGPSRRALGVAFLLSRRADVTITVRRGRRVVAVLRRGARAANRVHRLRIGAGGLRRGVHSFTLSARTASGRTATAKLMSERL